MQDRLESLLREAEEAESLIHIAPDLVQLENLRVKLLGKSSLIIELSKGVWPNCRTTNAPSFGKKINEVRNRYTSLLDQKSSDLESKGGVSAMPSDLGPYLAGPAIIRGQNASLGQGSTGDSRYFQEFRV